MRNRGGIINTLRNPSLSETASSGQNREQTPQPKQAFSSRCATPSSFSIMASVGHHSTQVPQPVQDSVWQSPCHWPEIEPCLVCRPLQRLFLICPPAWCFPCSLPLSEYEFHSDFVSRFGQVLDLLKILLKLHIAKTALCWREKWLVRSSYSSCSCRAFFRALPRRWSFSGESLPT